MFRNESALRNFVMKKLRLLRQAGVDIYAVKINDRTTAGISDILACINGRFVAIELKQPGNKATALQLYFIENVKAAGGLGGVCYSWEDVASLLEKAGVHTE